MPSQKNSQVLVLVAALIVLPAATFAGVISADLSITKTDGATTATPGASVVYTITAANAGSADVTGATVADTFPAILSCTWTCSASAGSSCTASGSGNINDAVNLLNGGTATYTATCTITSSATGSLANTATISSATTDPNPANNSATDTDTLAPSADLSMTAVASPNPMQAGDPVTITISVDNAGPSDATGVVVTTTLPSFLTFDSTSGCGEDPNGNPTCTLGTVAAGGSDSFTLMATANPNSSATGSMTVSVASSTTDPDTTNNRAVETMEVVAAAAVPTTGELGLMLLALLILGAGVWVIRQ